MRAPGSSKHASIKPAAPASALRSLPSYQAPPVGRATEEITATVAARSCVQHPGYRGPTKSRTVQHDVLEESGQVTVCPRIG